uniref:Uncharacterized protein n=1 Tax=Oncorhynchus mykiss TaxID=8022 RepID=A0A8K9V024_ONCMY
MCPHNTLTYILHALPPPPFLSPVDHSMFENSNASRAPGQWLQASRLTQASARHSLVTANPALGSSPAEAPSSTTTNGGQQRLKNALNLGKAVGAKVNDLLRRKEPSHIGDIGVTEINKNVGAVWSEEVHASQDSFPRLDPPPPGKKKRLPRTLKTTQDMMISSDPVVTTPPETLDHSLLSSPNKTSLISNDERKEEETEERREGEQTQIQLQLSVPDLIHKDHLVPPRSRTSEPRQKAPGADTRLASTPVKAPYRISVSEDGLMENSSLCGKGSADTEEPEQHPDLL